MKRNIWAALVVCSAVAQTPGASDIAARLTANNLKADVSFLASDALEGRGTPSRGLDIAAEFIASEFLAAGLEPAGDDGYFQTAPFVRVTPEQEGRALTLEVGGQAIEIEKAKLAVADAADALNLENAAVIVAASI